MAHERLIDLSRRDLLGPPIDHIIFAAMKCEEAFLIETADVARSKPPIEKDARLSSGALR